MARALLVLVALVPLAAFADPPGVATRAPTKHVIETALVPSPADGVCDSAILPLQWADASDAWAFADAPTARLDEQELWATTQLRGLVQLTLTVGWPRLYVLGAPATTHIMFSNLGWRPRWPFC